MSRNHVSARSGSAKNGRKFSGPNQSPNTKKRGRPISDLQDHQFVRAARPLHESNYEAKRLFADFDLHRKLKFNLEKIGYKKPTEIQDRTIEHIVAGNDLLGIAKTGTGKTAAFLIPIVQRLLTEANPFKTLVVVPTRELAIQVKEEFWKLTKGMNFYSDYFIGGTNVNQDVRKLQRDYHLIVGTPGRLLDLSGQKALRLEEFDVLILDEYDRMLDMGFVEDVKRISNAMGDRSQTLLFSATYNSNLPQLVNNPLEVKIKAVETIDHIEQDIVRVEPGGSKFHVLLDMVKKEDFEKVILFAETKRAVNRLSVQLSKNGIEADCIHGDKSQNNRQRALAKLKKGNIKVLVATDVAARGIDVSDVTHVINYEKPVTYESYVHRIGRTGRAGKRGYAYTFVN